MLERLFICVRLLVYSRVSVDCSHVWIQKGRKESLALRRIGGLLLGRTHDHSTNTFNDKPLSNMARRADGIRIG
jgi:hypothetical protein